MSDEFIRKSVTIEQLDVSDDAGNTWTRLNIEYKSGPAYGCYLDMDEVSDIFLLKNAIDEYIEKYDLKPHES